MKKQIISILAAAGILFTSSNCCVRASITSPTTQQAQQNQTLEQLVKTTYCLNNDYVYQDKEGNTITPGSYGSAFAYREVDGFYYLITNQHVLGEPEIEIAGNKLKRIFHTSKIVDSRHDQDPSDDIYLETVFESEELDLAILRTRTPLNFISESYFGDSDTLRYGEEIYLIGYPLGLFPAITKGIVANPGEYTYTIEVEESQLNLTASSLSKKVLDLSISPGNSGGPFFVERDNQFYWMGIVNAYLSDSQQRKTGLVLGIESNLVREIADYAIINADTLVKDREEKLICREK